MFLYGCRGGGCRWRRGPAQPLHQRAFVEGRPGRWFEPGGGAVTNPRGLTHLAAWESGSGLVNVVIEAPRGSRNKYKYDERHGLFRLSKVLPLGACFPYDFGFIPSTRAEDGDPVDVLVLTEEPAFAGCVLPVRLLGVIEAEQTEGGKTVRNDRLVGAVETPYN